MIVWVNVVLNRIVVVDSDRRSDNQCDSHLQSQSELYHGKLWYLTLAIDLTGQLQRWLYWHEHLKHVWNVYCIATNHRWDLHTTETTGNDSFQSVMEKIIFVLFKDTNCLIRNLKHHCSPGSVLRTASSTSFDFRKRKVLEANATRRRPAFHVTTYHMKTIKNEQSWCFRFW